MPVRTKRIGDKLRLIESETGRIAKTKSGKPRDGGGGTDESVRRQARAINMSMKGKKGKRFK